MKNIYRISFTGWEENIVYVMSHKKKFSKKEMDILLEALLKRNAIKYLMNTEFRIIGVNSLYEETYNDLLNLGFKDFIENMTVISKFCDDEYDGLLNNVTKKMNFEETLRIIKKYYPDDYYYDDEINEN